MDAVHVIVTVPPVVPPVMELMVKAETRGRASASVLDNQTEHDYEKPKSGGHT